MDNSTIPVYFADGVKTYLSCVFVHELGDPTHVSSLVFSEVFPSLEHVFSDINLEIVVLVCHDFADQVLALVSVVLLHLGNLVELHHFLTFIHLALLGNYLYILLLCFLLILFKLDLHFNLLFLGLHFTATPRLEGIVLLSELNPLDYHKLNFSVLVLVLCDFLSPGNEGSVLPVAPKRSYRLREHFAAHGGLLATGPLDLLFQVSFVALQFARLFKSFLYLYD